jgi:integral membrane protein
MMSTPLGRLRLLGLLEGVSCLVLFLVAMPLKYAAGNPVLIYPVGLAHGVLFVGYVAAAAWAAKVRKWPLSRLAVALAAAFVPFGTFVFDGSLRREQQSEQTPAEA